jgi:hypothetical protein
MRETSLILFFIFIFIFLCTLFLGGANVSDPELKLSLGSGEYYWSKGSAKRSGFHKEAHSCIHNVIDLEESIERVSNEDEKRAPSFSNADLKTHSGRENESEVSVLPDPIISSSVKKDLRDGIADNCSLVDDRKCCQGQNSFNKGTVDLYTRDWF